LNNQSTTTFLVGSIRFGSENEVRNMKRWRGCEWYICGGYFEPADYSNDVLSDKVASLVPEA
jgi:hypothetical protein